MIQEEWVVDHPDGTWETATLEHEIGGEYFVDMGCQLWNRYYKSYGWAKRYLERCGYTKVGTLITVEGIER